jgi:hypothetical protein
VDVSLLQVTTPVVGEIPGYTIYYIGTMMRGTAIITQSTLQLTKITALPSGRKMAANLGELRMVNI